METRLELPWPTGTQTIFDILRSAVAEAERRARVRRIRPEHLAAIAEAVCQHRAGTAEADGGAVPYTDVHTALTTRVEVAWWRRRGILNLYLSAERDLAEAWGVGRGPDYAVRAGPGREAFRKAAPDRYRLYVELADRRIRRRLEQRGFEPPPVPVERVLLDRPAGLMVVTPVPWTEVYLCTAGAVLPLGYVNPNCLTDPQPAADLLRRVGLPHEVCRRYADGSIGPEELVAEAVQLALEVRGDGCQGV